MTDTTNPRAEFDKALAAMRHTKRDDSTVRVTLATVACAEALALLVDAHLAAPAPEPAPADPDPREPLPDDTIVGHGWVVMKGWTSYLFRPEGNDRFTAWIENRRTWGGKGQRHEPEMSGTRPATVGDLRRMGVPESEWPDITAPEPEPPTCWDEWESGDVWAWGGTVYRMGDDRVLRLATINGRWVPSMLQPGEALADVILTAPTEEHMARVAAADEAARLPDEPPVGSVVLDCDGDEWFRTVDGWRTALSGRTREWAELHRKCGPVTVIHRAES